jgi:hypothetical protein
MLLVDRRDDIVRARIPECHFERASRPPLGRALKTRRCHIGRSESGLSPSGDARNGRNHIADTKAGSLRRPHLPQQARRILEF